MNFGYIQCHFGPTYKGSAMVTKITVESFFTAFRIYIFTKGQSRANFLSEKEGLSCIRNKV